MSRSRAPRLVAYTALAGLGLIAALALRRAELAAVAAPFALLAVFGARAVPPDVRGWFELKTERALEGDVLEAVLTVRSTRAVDRLEIGLVAPRGIRIEDSASPVSIRLGAGEEREIPLRLVCERWGSYELGDVRLRARDRIGVVSWEARVDRRRPVRVYPRPERLQELLAPAETQATTGSEVARIRAEGLEFADTRPFVTGDRLRSVNWRASARRGSLIVNLRHPERNADVVLFLDSFAEVRDAAEGTFERAIGVAATLAARFLERRDRVGLVAFGGILRWLEPGAGMAQRYRLVDVLLETGIEFSYAWKDVNVIPARTLPPRALVIAVSPLLDERSLAALVDLRARGHDLVVVEVSPEPYTRMGASELDRLAHRIWLLQRAELRSRFARLGVAVTTLDAETPLDVALEGVRSYRRHARLARR